MITIEWGAIASLSFWLAIPLVGWLISEKSTSLGVFLMVGGGVVLALVVIPIIAEAIAKILRM